MEYAACFVKDSQGFFRRSLIESCVTKTQNPILVNNKPVMVIMKTEMGAGVDFMMHSHKWHGVAPNDEQLATALGQLEETLGDY